MLCSNCRVIEIHFESREPTICENGHHFCEKCMLQTRDKCMLCEGRMINYVEQNTIVGIGVTESTPAPQSVSSDVGAGLPNVWSNGNEIYDSVSPECYTTDYCLLSERWSATPLNLGFSNSGIYQDQASGSNCNLTDLWISDCYVNSLSDPSSSPLQNNSHEHGLSVEKERIRSRLVDEILTSFREDLLRERYMPIKHLQTIGVSTESMPKLPQDESKTSATAKCKVKTAIVKKPAEFEEIPALIGDCHKSPVGGEKKTKSQTSNLELKLHQVMRTGPDSTSDHRFTADCLPLPSKMSDDFSHPSSRERELEPEQSIVSPARSANSGDVQSHEEPTDLPSIVTSIRAFYHRQSIYQLEIVPQFQPLSFLSGNLSNPILSTELVDVATLNIPRSPIFCPISTCRRAYFVSDFTKHIAVDHTRIHCERIRPRQCWNFFLDPNLIHLGANRCQILLLVRDKIKNLGHDKFKDLIPIMVMTTKISLLEMCCNQKRPPNSAVARNGQQNFIMIWLTGLAPPQLPIYFYLTVWARSGCIPICHLVHSGRLYSMRDSQTNDDIQKSGQMMLLSENQVNLLTNNGRRMLEIQVAVH